VWVKKMKMKKLRGVVKKMRVHMGEEVGGEGEIVWVRDLRVCVRQLRNVGEEDEGCG
jgi:hypothetical protein